MNTRKTILFRVPPEVKEWLEEQAAANHRTITGELLQLLETARKVEQLGEAA